MGKKQDRKNIKQAQRQKIKLSLKLTIATSLVIAVIVSGVFIYLNFSNSKKSNADAGFQIGKVKPVDFNVTYFKNDYSDIKINGVRVRKAIIIDKQEQ